MNACPCGSLAINPHLHGREPGIDDGLCDVCYWRNMARKWMNLSNMLARVNHEIILERDELRKTQLLTGQVRAKYVCRRCSPEYCKKYKGKKNHTDCDSDIYRDYRVLAEVTK